VSRAPAAGPRLSGPCRQRSSRPFSHHHQPTPTVPFCLPLFRPRKKKDRQQGPDESSIRDLTCRCFQSHKLKPDSAAIAVRCRKKLCYLDGSNSALDDYSMEISQPKSLHRELHHQLIKSHQNLHALSARAFVTRKPAFKAPKRSSCQGGDVPRLNGFLSCGRPNLQFSIAQWVRLDPARHLGSAVSNRKSRPHSILSPPGLANICRNRLWDPSELPQCGGS
jgi:hypothetical protein